MDEILRSKIYRENPAFKKVADKFADDAHQKALNDVGVKCGNVVLLPTAGGGPTLSFVVSDTRVDGFKIGVRHSLKPGPMLIEEYPAGAYVVDVHNWPVALKTMLDLDNLAKVAQHYRGAAIPLALNPAIVTNCTQYLVDDIKTALQGQVDPADIDTFMQTDQVPAPRGALVAVVGQKRKHPRVHLKLAGGN